MISNVLPTGGSCDAPFWIVSVPPTIAELETWSTSNCVPAVGPFTSISSVPLAPCENDPVTDNVPAPLKPGWIVPPLLVTVAALPPFACSVPMPASVPPPMEILLASDATMVASLAADKVVVPPVCVYPFAVRVAALPTAIEPALVSAATLWLFLPFRIVRDPVALFVARFRRAFCSD